VSSAQVPQAIFETPAWPEKPPESWLTYHLAHPGPGAATPGDPNPAFFWNGRYHLHGNAWYPLLAERRLGNGRTTAWTTGASPHWGVNFMKWEQYDRFWQQLFAPDSQSEAGRPACRPEP